MTLSESQPDVPVRTSCLKGAFSSRGVASPAKACSDASTLEGGPEQLVGERAADKEEGHRQQFARMFDPIV
jgi:hypothetical protein